MYILYLLVNEVRLIYYIHKKSNTPFSYMLCLFCKKPIGELNQERALDEDTGVFSFFFSSLSSYDAYYDDIY